MQASKAGDAHAADYGPLTLGHFAEPRLSWRRLGRTLLLFPEIDSTNTFLVRHADELPDGTIVLAEHQTTGRGRRGQPWLSPRGASILLSVLLHETGEAPLHNTLSSLACLAVCETIAAVTACKPIARWPNDISIAGKKVGGVLAETRSLAAQRGACAFVLGIGVNCLQQRGHFPPSLSALATSLEIESAAAVSRVTVALGLLSRLDAILAQPRSTARDDSARLWREFGEPAGTRFVLQRSGQTCEGSLVSVDAQGDAVLRDSDGSCMKVRSGEWKRLWNVL